MSLFNYEFKNGMRFADFVVYKPETDKVICQVRFELNGGIPVNLRLVPCIPALNIMISENELDGCMLLPRKKDEQKRQNQLDTIELLLRQIANKPTSIF